MRRSPSWYGIQRQRDTDTTSASEAMLGPEKKVFEEVMGVTVECLDLAASKAPITDLVSKRKVAFATYGFDLLWSAWSAMLAARYDVAASLWRSIAEVPEFLMGLRANPNLAHDMGRVKVDVYAARRAIRRGLDRLKPGSGADWHLRKQEEDKFLHPFAHATTESTGAMLGITRRSGIKIGLMRPGGVIGDLMLRATAMYLAVEALALSEATVLALQDVTGDIQEVWRVRGRGVCEKAAETLSAEFSRLEFHIGDVAQIGLLRHDEEPADPQEPA